MPDPTQTTLSPNDRAPPNQASPAAGGGASPQAATSEATRPDYLPEAFWDADTKTAKVDTLAGEFKKLDDVRQADEQRKASLPKTADEYKAELPQAFQLPENWEVKADDPMWAAGRAFAHKNGLSQEQFSDLAALYVQNQIAQQSGIKQAIEARDASLGANGGARVEAVNTWFKGMFGDQVGAQFAQTLFTKDIIEGFEKIQGVLASQGVTTFSGSGRNDSQPDPSKIDGYDKMSFTEKWRNRRQVSA